LNTTLQIEDTHKRRQIPIVVGGTSYWIQHLIFPNRLASDNSSSSSDESVSISKDLANSVASLPPHLLSLFNDLPRYPPSARTDPDAAFNLHTLLATLDPPIAQRWHWRDTRKILRSLCIIKEYGRRPSEMIDDQSKGTTTNLPRFGLLLFVDLLILNIHRFRTLFFWIYAEPSVLDIRLNERVDVMMEV
jgi:tRNA dimethylallyltransferase